MTTGLGFAFGVRVVTAPHRWQWAVPVSHSDQICVDWIFQRRGATSPPRLPFLSQWRSQVLSPYSSKGLLKVRRDRASPGHGSLRKFPWQCLDCDPEVVWHPYLASCVATLSSPCVQCHCGLTAEIKHYFYARVRALFSACLALSLTGPLAPHHPATAHLCWLLSTISCALRSARPGTTSFRMGWPCQLCSTFSSHPVA